MTRYEVYGKNKNDKDFKFYEYPHSFVSFIITIIKHMNMDELHAHKRT